jgi:hypothetical protein
VNIPSTVTASFQRRGIRQLIADFIDSVWVHMTRVTATHDLGREHLNYTPQSVTWSSRDEPSYIPSKFQLGADSMNASMCLARLVSSIALLLSGAAARGQITFFQNASATLSGPGTAIVFHFSNSAGTHTQSGVLAPGMYSLRFDDADGSGGYSNGDSLVAVTFQLSLGAPVAVTQSVRFAEVAVGGAAGHTIMDTTSASGPYEFVHSLYFAEPNLTCTAIDLAMCAVSLSTTGPATAQTQWNLSAAARAAHLFWCGQGGGGAQWSLQDGFVVTAPTSYSMSYMLSEESGAILPSAGSSQTIPVLPGTSLGPSAGFGFNNVPSGNWFDPPAAYGFSFVTGGPSNFSQIANLPSGIDADNMFAVRSGGQTLGVFSVGQTVDFVALTGSAVPSFEILSINPFLDGTDPAAFPIQLAFDAPMASFTMVPINMIPTSPFCFGDGTGGACPCGNSGAPGNGCDNSHATGGAALSSFGVSSLGDDSLVLTSAGELPTALSIPTQGTTVVSRLFLPL